MSLNRTLLHGISDFWLRYFSDLPILEVLHRSTLEACAMAYQKMLLSLMRMSLEDAPLTERVPWTPVFISENMIREVQGPNAEEDRWIWPLNDHLRYFTLFHNTVISPTKVLEKDFDFEIIENGSGRWQELRALNPSLPETGWYLGFYKDPFDESGDGTGKVSTGFSYLTRRFDLPVRLTDVKSDFDFTAQGLAVGDYIRSISLEGVATLHLIKTISESYLEVDIRTPFLATGELAGYTAGENPPFYLDKILQRFGTVSASIKEVRTLSGWVPDAEVDSYSIYAMFGHSFVNSRQDSTQEFKDFIRGVWNLYVRGPSLERVESALNVVMGYPVVRTTGETLVSLVMPAAGNIVITTDEQVYEFPNKTPIRDAVVYATPTVNGEDKDDLFSLFTDTVVLDTITTFDTFGIDIATDVLRHTAGGVDTDYVIDYHTDVYLKIHNANALADFPGPGPYQGIEWRLIRNPNPPGGAGEIELAVGLNGAMVQNSVVPLELEAFDALTDSFLVTDYVDTPDWWETIVIPSTLIPGMSLARRVVTNVIYDNIVNNPAGNPPALGDIGLLIGRDEDNVADVAGGIRYLIDNAVQIPAVPGSPALPTDFIAQGVVVGDKLLVTPDPVAAEESRDIEAVGKYWVRVSAPFGGVARDGASYRITTAAGAAKPNLGAVGNLLATGHLRYSPGRHHSVAWLIMKKFLQWHMFTVAFDFETSPYTQTTTFLMDLILAGKPAYTYPFVEPSTGFTDNIGPILDEIIGIKGVIPLQEQGTGVENHIGIGARGIEWFSDTKTDFSFLALGDLNGGSIKLVNFGNNPPNYDNGVTLSLPIDWVSTYQVSAAPAVFSNRAKWQGASLPGRSNLTYQLLNAVPAVLYDSTVGPATNTGRLLGGVGANGFIGGMDPFVDQHEITLTDVNAITVAGIPENDVPGIPQAVKDLVVAKFFDATTGNLVAHTLTDGVNPYAVLETSGLMHVSDVNIEREITPPAGQGGCLIFCVPNNGGMFPVGL